MSPLFDFDALRPPRRMLVSEWANEYRILSRISSGEPGRYRTDRVPYWVEVMDSLSPYNPVQQVTLMKGAQIGASEMALTWLAYLMSEHSGVGGPAMLVQPTIDLAQRFIKTRVDPMIRDPPALARRVQRSGAASASSITTYLAGLDRRAVRLLAPTV